jgi:tRNA(fMet)-specific endonuclease VapC
MTLRYLVDTDWVIHYLNGHPDIAARLSARFEQGLALSVISLAELYEGVFYSRDPESNERVLQEFLEGMAVLGIDDPVCRIFAQERGRLRKARQIIGDCDLLIGATTLRHGLTVLTNNRRHFERIEGLVLESA